MRPIKIYLVVPVVGAASEAASWAAVSASRAASEAASEASEAAGVAMQKKILKYGIKLLNK